MAVTSYCLVRTRTAKPRPPKSGGGVSINLVSDSEMPLLIMIMTPAALFVYLPPSLHPELMARCSSNWHFAIGPSSPCRSCVPANRTMPYFTRVLLISTCL